MEKIETVSFHKYLGFWINDKLCLKKHIDEMTKSLKAKLAFFNRNKPYIFPEITGSYFFFQGMNYSDVIYMHSPASTLNV